jgi:hypothetical protein
MNKTNIIIIIYAIGIVIGALFLDIWGAETSLKKAMTVIIWTAIFLITLFLSERNDNK